ncbi:CSC1-like protein 2 [Parasteatoda tepidariorum]|nr:CSC1-like protein 2 [Parasteatoda tepidariorum]XP_015924375.2 CSC1-like protein 2 [Parasteatoda tepidariorum]XP_042909381.1 CSC1-like protein 2 [Parasteatoda tepidariorum]
MVYQYASSFPHVVVADDDVPTDNDSYKCSVLKSNHSILVLSGKFEGIPDNLMINVATWLLLLIIFTFLRKRAWDYGRIALVQKNDQRWTQLFYGDGAATSHHLNNEEGSIDSVEIALHMDKGICSWLRAIFVIKDDQILKRNGPDALQYLSFQRHIIVYLAIICVICLTLVLPVNYQGDLVDEESKFGRTTLSNLDPASSYLWVHVGCSFLFLLLGISVMKHFSANLKLNDNESFVNRTLMIFNVPKDLCEESILLQHFQEAYQDCSVEKVNLAYDVRTLTKLDSERETSTHARIYCENILKETGIRPRMRPHYCGHICVCSRCEQVDALDYYTEEEHALATAVDRQRSVSLLKPVGLAFVTLKTEEMAERIYKDYQKHCQCTVSPSSSSYSRQLNPYNWTVDFAYPPEDIFWENLSVSKSLWYTRAFTTNFALFILFFFLTTPTIVLSYLDILYTPAAKKLVRETPVIKDFFSTLMLLLFSSLLPVIVSFSDRFMPHWTRSSRNHSKMLRTFIFLLFMVVILPLLQLTSVKALLEWSIRKGETYRWQCVFLSGNGAFFVNYVITASFIGTALDLIRFPELFMYAFYICFSRSRAEQAGLRKAILWEFEFGVQYAYYLLIFSVVIIYSVLCPLITPFGLVYVCLKHFIDRYNIFYVYGPSKISRNIHATAINCVVMSIILMQMCIFFFLYLRNGWMQMSIVSLGICLMTAMIFIGQIFFQWFLILSPISYKAFSSQSRRNSSEPSRSDEISQQPYLPMVLKRSASKGEIFTTIIQDRSYGTNEDSVQSTPDGGSLNIPDTTECDNFASEHYQRF